MALYFMGDIQGCDAALERWIAHAGFSPSRDTLYVVGDLVNRGPASAAVLRRLMALGDAARCLLGNHDLHLLAVAHGVRQAGAGDTFSDVLAAPDRAALLDWLRRQPLARHLAHAGESLLLVHAGVLPQWTSALTLELADELQAGLGGADVAGFLRDLFGNEPARWSDQLRGAERRRLALNALTRLRYCTPEGRMEFKAKGRPGGQRDDGLVPWFEAPGRRTRHESTVLFGHWSTLGWMERDGVVALDTGCVWGGCLSALRLGAAPAARERVAVQCEAAQAPGGD